MPFNIYLYKDVLSSQKSSQARKAAFNAVTYALDKQGEAIEGEFGNRDWVAVL
jgi:hypothetical protein